MWKCMFLKYILNTCFSIIQHMLIIRNIIKYLIESDTKLYISILNFNFKYASLQCKKYIIFQIILNTFRKSMLYFNLICFFLKSGHFWGRYGDKLAVIDLWFSSFRFSSPLRIHWDGTFSVSVSIAYYINRERPVISLDLL